MGVPVDISGQKFGLLTAIRVSDERPKGKRVWVCRCDCGGESLVPASMLRFGNTQSCGCRKRAVLGENSRTHGMSRSPLYSTWCHLRRRCLNPDYPAFKDYGGRGISVCERWASFKNFRDDMAPTYAPGLSIDRIDNDGNYEPSNCRWADDITQANNKRNNRWIDTPNGQMTIPEAARAFGLKDWTIRDRLKTSWPRDKLCDPIGARGRIRRAA